MDLNQATAHQLITNRLMKMEEQIASTPSGQFIDFLTMEEQRFLNLHLPAQYPRQGVTNEIPNNTFHNQREPAQFTLDLEAGTIMVSYAQ